MQVGGGCVMHVHQYWWAWLPRFQRYCYEMIFFYFSSEQTGQVKCSVDPYFIVPDKCKCVDFQVSETTPIIIDYYFFLIDSEAPGGTRCCPQWRVTASFTAVL